MTIIAPEGVLRDKIRQDEFKLQIIMQYLESRGLIKTLAQLEEESETLFACNALPIGGLLDLALDEYQRRLNVPESVLPGTIYDLPEPGTCATEISLVHENVHDEFNPTAVAWGYADNSLFTGGVDKRVQEWAIYSGKRLEKIREFNTPSPVLSIDTSVQGDVLVTCMGGEVQINTDHVFKPHGTNRVTCGEFSPCGKFFATCGRDIAVHVFYKTMEGEWTQMGKSVVRCEKEISCICWITDEVLAVAETDNCMIGVYRVGENGKERIGQVCMNLSIDDPRTPFTMLNMTCQGNLLAGCTTRNSALLFKIPDDLAELRETLCPIKTYYGMSVGIYDFPAINFSTDGSFLLVTSDKEIIVFEVKTCHKVFALAGSRSKPIRSLSRHPYDDRIATVSFDKTLSVLN